MGVGVVNDGSILEEGASFIGFGCLNAIFFFALVLAPERLSLAAFWGFHPPFARGDI